MSNPFSTPGDLAKADQVVSAFKEDLSKKNFADLCVLGVVASMLASSKDHIHGTLFGIAAIWLWDECERRRAEMNDKEDQ